MYDLTHNHRRGGEEGREEQREEREEQREQESEQEGENGEREVGGSDNWEEWWNMFSVSVDEFQFT
jgi:hypothetical protein